MKQTLTEQQLRRIVNEAVKQALYEDGLLKNAWGTVKGAAKTAAGGVATGVGALGTGVAGGVATMGAAAGKTLQASINMIVKAKVLPLQAGILGLTKTAPNNPGFKTALAGLKTLQQGLTQATKYAYQNVGKTATQSWNNTKNVAQKTANFTKNAAQQTAQKAQAAGQNIGRAAAYVKGAAGAMNQAGQQSVAQYNQQHPAVQGQA